MSGETDLKKLLQTMRPEQNVGEYVFCVVESWERAAALQPVCTFQEREGVTVILSRQRADQGPPGHRVGGSPAAA